MSKITPIFVAFSEKVNFTDFIYIFLTYKLHPGSNFVTNCIVVMTKNSIIEIRLDGRPENGYFLLIFVTLTSLGLRHCQFEIPLNTQYMYK